MVGVPQHVSTLLKINCGIRSDSAAHATIEVSGMNQRKNLPKLAMTTWLRPGQGDSQLHQDRAVQNYETKHATYIYIYTIILLVDDVILKWLKCQFMVYPQNDSAQNHDVKTWYMGYGHPSHNKKSSLNSNNSRENSKNHTNSRIDSYHSVFINKYIYIHIVYILCVYVHIYNYTSYTYKCSKPFPFYREPPLAGQRTTSSLSEDPESESDSEELAPPQNLGPAEHG